MHSSRMRTARALTVSPSMLCAVGGVYLVPGVYLFLGDVLGPGGCTWSQGGVPGQGVYLVPGGVPGPRGVYLVRGVPGPRGVYLVPGGAWSWGVYLVWGAPGLGGTWSRGYLLGGVYLVRGVYLVQGGTWSGTPSCGQNHRHL